MKLNIRISDTDICFAIYEAGNPPTFTFQPYHVKPQVSLMVNLRTAISQIDMLQHTFEQVAVYVNAPVTPVPLTEFQEEDVDMLYKYCFSSSEKQRVFYDTVPASNAVLLFGLSENTCRTLEEAFGNVRYTAALTPVVQHFARKSVMANETKRLFVYTHDGVIDVVVLDESRLVMLNTYSVQTLTDVDYYVFNMAKHLGVDVQSTPIFVAGIPMLREPVVSELQKYANSVYSINPSGEFNRNIVSITEGVPYDLMCALLRKSQTVSITH